MSMFPWKPGGLPVAEEQALRSGVSTGVPAHARMQRVKVYSLTDDGKWDDQGTGHVTIDYIEGSRELALTVVDEVDNDTLLLHNITSDDIYRKQEGTIISWKDPEKALELALSFQEAAGCSYIWENMHHIQQNLQINVLHPQVGSHPAFESREASRESIPHDESLISVHGELKDLPPLDLSSLPLMLKVVLEHGRADQTRVAELIYQDHEFFPKLASLFRTCEDLNNMDGLHMIFRLVKGIISLNNSAIFDKVFSDALILDIIGALEYDPEVHDVRKHRKILQNNVVFKKAIPIKNAFVVSKIHQTYRIGYIKDFIFQRAIDDATLASLNSIIEANSAIVSQLLTDDASFIHELITRMKSSNLSAESRSNLVQFLDEFCTLSKSLQPAQRSQLCRDFVSEGVFDVISDVLQSHDKSLISTGVGILMHFINQDRNLVVSYIAHQDETCQEGNSLLETLIQGMSTDSGGEMHGQYSEILRTLMDSSPAYKGTDHKEVAIQIFYEKHIHKLIDVLASSSCPKVFTQSTPGSVGVAPMVKTEILLNICELLCFCVLHHPDRIKLSFYSSNLLEKILNLTRQRAKSLVVAAVRFMRTVIGRKDEFLIDRVIKFNLLKPIIEVFVENGNRYNMLHSGVLELLEYIRKENIDSLVEYVYNSFWGQLVNFEHLKSIQDFKLKYQQIMESANTKPSTNLIDMRKKAEERGVDKQEEDNFNKDSDGEGSPKPKRATHERKQSMFKSADGSETCHVPARPKLVGLVDYDDDDEKVFNPPPKTAVSSDEDDQVVHIPILRRSSMDGKNTDVKANKKPKLEVRISCAKIVPAVNVTDKPSDLEDNTKAPLSPPTCLQSSEDDKDLGDGSPGSQIEQRAAQNLDSVHQTGMDCTEAAKNSSPKTD